MVLPTSFSAGYPVAHDITGNGYPDLLLGGRRKPNPGQPHDSFNHVFWNGPDGLRAGPAGRSLPSKLRATAWRSPTSTATGSRTC